MPVAASKTTYGATQPLGAAMRAAGVDACRYASARDAEGGTNIALFSPATSVEVSKHDYFDRQRFRFTREAFLAAGVLPQPAIQG